MRATADLERVVAADRGVTLAVIGDHHRVVDEVRLAGFEDGPHSVLDQVVGRDVRVDLQGDVGHRLTQRAFDPEDRTGDPAVVGTDVEVHERVGQHAVDADPEPAQFAVESFVGDVLGDERSQHLVEVTEIDGIRRDARDVGVHHLQERQRVVEIRRRWHLEIREPLADRQLVIGEDVASGVRGVALVHVADHPLVERCLACRGDGRTRQHLRRQHRQSAQLLVVGQRAILHEFPGANCQLGDLHNSNVRQTRRG